MNRNQRNASHRRPGFTLVEILVVIAIIAILASLLLGAVMYVRSGGETLKNRNDILQLSSAMQKFYADYKFYPPDQIRLCSNHSQYGATAPDKQSLQCLGRMFPNLPGNFTNIWWDGKAHPNGTNLDFTLEGDQALVFFLGGPPNGANTPALLGGFSTNPTDPVDVLNVAPNRKKSMDFDMGRLQLVARAGNNASANFPSYMDVYKKMPFVFFSSNGRANGYSTASNTLGPAPYFQQAAPKTYCNPSEFQIISAGVDGLFGAGGLWTPATIPTMTPAGKDDMSNFSDKLLGLQ